MERNISSKAIFVGTCSYSIASIASLDFRSNCRSKSLSFATCGSHSNIAVPTKTKIVLRDRLALRTYDFCNRMEQRCSTVNTNCLSTNWITSEHRMMRKHSLTTCSFRRIAASYRSTLRSRFRVWYCCPRTRLRLKRICAAQNLLRMVSLLLFYFLLLNTFKKYLILFYA